MNIVPTVVWLGWTTFGHWNGDIVTTCEKAAIQPDSASATQSLSNSHDCFTAYFDHLLLYSMFCTELLTFNMHWCPMCARQTGSTKGLHTSFCCIRRVSYLQIPTSQRSSPKGHSALFAEPLSSYSLFQIFVSKVCPHEVRYL